jgi:deoxyribonuclease-4
MHKPLSFLFGTVGSPVATPPTPGGSIGGIQYAASLGLDALELAWVRGVRIGESACEAIRQAACEHRVVLSVHAPYYINLNAVNDKWPRLRGYLMDAANFGNLAGATDIIFHPGTYFGQPPDEVLKVAIPRLRDCVDELRRSGNQVNLRPETSGKGTMLGSLDDILEMAAAVPGVKPCLDFAHLHARTGNGAMNTYLEWTEMLKKYSLVMGKPSLRELHIHLSGIDYGPRGEKNHLVMEQADLNFKDLMQALVDMQAAGRLLCESPNLEVDALKFRHLWQEVSGEESTPGKKG